MSDEQGVADSANEGQEPAESGGEASESMTADEAPAAKKARVKEASGKKSAKNVVTAIAAPASFKITFHGKGGHAGTVLMPDRKDAMVPAAHLITLAEQLARDSKSPDSVATVGIVDVHPSAINSIPRTVTISFDIRDTDLECREDMVAQVLNAAATMAESRGLGYEVEMINSDPPAQADEDIQTAITRACQSAGLTHMPIVSRAYHDSLFIARKAPMGMIFVPSKDGVSHRPDEFTSTAQMQHGVEVLARTLAQLAG